MAKQRDPNQPAPWVSAISFASIGIEMGLCVAIGAVGGHWLDGKFDTAPWILLAGIGFGIGAAGKALFRAARQAKKKMAEDA